MNLIHPEASPTMTSPIQKRGPAAALESGSAGLGLDCRRTAAAILLGLTLAIGAAATVARGDPPSFSAQFITPGISAINASGMNESGDVVGTGTTGSGGWVSRAGAPAVLLPLPPNAQYAIANDINDAGVIVGSVGPSSYPGYAKAAAWIPDGSGGYTIQQFGTLPGDIYSEATAINNVGDIVGYSRDGMFRHPVLFTALGGIQNLTSTGIFDPSDINEHRVLVDHSYYTRRLDLNTMVVEQLAAPGPGFASSWAVAINESGQVAGFVTNTFGGTTCPSHAARYTDGVGWEVFSSCGSANSAWDMNDLGDVVMRLNLAPFVRFEGIGTFLIEDLIVADVGHWSVINGYGLTINNSRQMAVPATNTATNQSGIILLTPILAPGDIDGDGDVDLTDRALFVDVLLGMDQTPERVARSDVNSDGMANGADISPWVVTLLGG